LASYEGVWRSPMAAGLNGEAARTGVYRCNARDGVALLM
jgi:hypothetical protein